MQRCTNFWIGTTPSNSLHTRGCTLFPCDMSICGKIVSFSVAYLSCSEQWQVILYSRILIWNKYILHEQEPMMNLALVFATLTHTWSSYERQTKDWHTLFLVDKGELYGAVRSTLPSAAVQHGEVKRLMTLVSGQAVNQRAWPILIPYCFGQ